MFSAATEKREKRSEARDLSSNRTRFATLRLARFLLKRTDPTASSAARVVRGRRRERSKANVNSLMHLFISLLEYFLSHLEPPSAFRCSRRIYTFRRDTRARHVDVEIIHRLLFPAVPRVGLTTSRFEKNVSDLAPLR